MADELDFEVKGSDAQYVEVTLDPTESVIAEAGALFFVDEGIEYTTQMNDGTERGALSALAGMAKRAIVGESLFFTQFVNHDNVRRRVGFAGPYPGQIAAIDLRDHGGEAFFERRAFLAAARGTQMTIAFTRKLGATFFGGEGFILQKLMGDGLIFAHAGGTLIEKRLQGDKIKVSTGNVVGFTRGIDYDIETARNLSTMLFSGEGLFITTLRGTGTVWLQSNPISDLIALMPTPRSN